MIEPSVAFRRSIRDRLVTSPEVTELVSPSSIRGGTTRPDRFPSIILAGQQTTFLGRGSGGQLLARVFLDIHIWAIEDGADTAQTIGFRVCNALFDAPPIQDCWIDAFTRPGMRWMRDPQPDLSYTHGVGTTEAVLRWRL